MVRLNFGTVINLALRFDSQSEPFVADWGVQKEESVMKRARVIVLAIAFTAALGAAWIAKKIVSGPREVQEVEKTVGATDVLVAATDINLGDSVRADDLKWQQWPVEGVTPGLITEGLPAGRADQALWGGCARALHRRRADQGAEADQDLGRRRDGRHSPVGHARHLHANSRGDRGRRLHPSQRSRRCHFVAQDASGHPRTSP